MSISPGGDLVMESMAGTGMKRKQGEFEIKSEPASDVVGKGLISYEEACCYFGRFFQGCVSVERFSRWRRGKAD